jgi:hypothetical protein
MAAPIPIDGFSCRDQDHRRALQSLLSGNCHEETVTTSDFAEVSMQSCLPDGLAAARGVDEAASRRAPGGMALRDLQTGS